MLCLALVEIILDAEPSAGPNERQHNIGSDENGKGTMIHTPFLLTNV